MRDLLWLSESVCCAGTETVALALSVTVGDDNCDDGAGVNRRLDWNSAVGVNEAKALVALDRKSVV